MIFHRAAGLDRGGKVIGPGGVKTGVIKFPHLFDEEGSLQMGDLGGDGIGQPPAVQGDGGLSQLSEGVVQTFQEFLRDQIFQKIIPIDPQLRLDQALHKSLAVIVRRIEQSLQRGIVQTPHEGHIGPVGGGLGGGKARASRRPVLTARGRWNTWE